MTFVFRVQHAKQSKTNECPIRLFSFTDTWEVTLIKNKSNSDRPPLSFIAADRESFPPTSSPFQSRIGQSNDVLDNTLIQQKCNIIYIGEEEEGGKTEKNHSSSIRHLPRERATRDKRREKRSEQNRQRENTIFYWFENVPTADIQRTGSRRRSILFYQSLVCQTDDEPLHCRPNLR